MATAPVLVNGKGIAKRRADVLAFCKAELTAGRPFPATARVAHHMGWQPQSALDCLYRLAADGHLTILGRDPRTGRIQ